MTQPVLSIPTSVTNVSNFLMYEVEHYTPPLLTQHEAREHDVQRDINPLERYVNSLKRSPTYLTPRHLSLSTANVAMVEEVQPSTINGNTNPISPRPFPLDASDSDSEVEPEDGASLLQNHVFSPSS